MGVVDVAVSGCEAAGKMLAGRSHKYKAIPDLENEADEEDKRRETRSSASRCQVFLLITTAIAFALLFLLLLGFGLVSSLTPAEPSEPISRLWGPYSPFFSVPSAIDPATPPGCEITMAQVLSRHGARDPTTGRTSTFKALIDRIHTLATDYGPGFEFIKTFEYTLGAEQLTPFGERELDESGVAFYRRYQALAAKNDPFIRASGQERVVRSGQHWTQGFYRSKLADGHKGHQGHPDKLITIIPEGEGVNNTLDHGLCKSFEKGPQSHLGDKSRIPWRDIFTPPITARLNQNLPGVNFTADDTTDLMEVCAFETAVEGTLSPLCRLFTQEEWKDLEYYETLGKYYGYNAGNPLGPTQGVGFTNELLARLTRQPVHDHTSTNSTADSDPATFPLDRKLYADFSHDNDMMGIYGALGLYSNIQPLPKTRRVSPVENNGFTASWTVPFAARMYVEKMRCSGAGDEEMVRVLVNDRVVPLVGCGTDALGRCKLGAFVKSMEFARRGGHWDQCFKS